jgi:hypothetical protein
MVGGIVLTAAKIIHAEAGMMETNAGLEHEGSLDSSRDGGLY